MDVETVQQQIRQHLQGMNFPASKQDVMNWARQHGAGSEETETMKKMPMENFNSVEDVAGAAGLLQQMKKMS